KIDEQTCMCARDPRVPFGGLAVLKCAKDGRALLVEVRGDRSEQSAQATATRVSALRGALVAGAKFEDEADLTELLNRGMAARKALPADARELFDWENPSENWQWYDEISSRTSLLKLSYR